MRTKMLIGEERFKILKESKVAVFGIGGVGSFVTEAIARCGVEHIDIFDGDIVDITNINRQLIADMSTIGQPKVEVMKKRIERINEAAEVNANYVFINSGNINDYDFSNYDYVVDAIDTITSKLLIITRCHAVGVKVISSMGTGNKLNPCDLEVADIYSTQNCPLARVMRRELRKLGIGSLKVVYSREIPKVIPNVFGENGKPINASISFVPSAAGIIMASEVIKDIMTDRKEGE